MAFSFSLDFFSQYSFATIIVGVSVGVVFMASIAPIVHRTLKAGQSQTPRPALPEWTDSSRPAACLRCGTNELAHVSSVQVMSRQAPTQSLHLAGAAARPLELELLVCTGCGHTEWFAASPTALEPFRSRKTTEGGQAPYRS
jgi:hypothetical protein